MQAREVNLGEQSKRQWGRENVREDRKSTKRGYATRPATAEGDELSPAGKLWKTVSDTGLLRVLPGGAMELWSSATKSPSLLEENSRESVPWTSGLRCPLQSSLLGLRSKRAAPPPWASVSAHSQCHGPHRPQEVWYRS